MAANKKRPAKAQIRLDARAAAQAEVERLRAAQAAKDRRNRLLTIFGLVAVVVIAAVIVITVTLTNQGAAYKDAAPYPAGAQENGGLLMGEDMAPGGTAATGKDVVTVAVYSDYICPGCASLEAQLGSQLEDLAKSGDIALELHPVDFLDRTSSGTEYSKRATNAAMTVAKDQPDKFWAFHRALFEHQPGEAQEASVYDQSVIEDVARGAGVSDEVIAKFSKNEMDKWVNYATGQAQRDGVASTPTVLMGLNGKADQQFEGVGVIPLEDALANVRAGKTPDGK